MDKKFQKQIEKALKLRRKELFDQISQINDLLDSYTPPIRTKPIPINEQYRFKVLSAMPANKWRTVTEIRKQTGMYQKTTQRTLDELIADKVIRYRAIGGIAHYQKPSLVVVAGEGIRAA